MGSFSSECVSGCTCEGLKSVSATHEWHSSIYKFAYFAVSQSPACRIRVTSLAQPALSGHKIKFDTLMVASGVGGAWQAQMNVVEG